MNKTFALTIAGLMLAVSTTTIAQSASIQPHRAIIDKKHRIVTFKISNPGAQATSYDINLIDRSQKEDSSTVLDNNYRLSAKKHIKLSPRRKITIKGNSSKSVRIKVKNLSKLADGEYRSYFKITPSLVISTEDNDSIQKLKINTSIEVPIILRKGTLSSKVTISSKYYKGKLTYKIDYKGDKSFFGDLEILKGKTSIHKISSFAIYPESAQIIKSIPADLTENDSITISLSEVNSSGNLKVTAHMTPTPEFQSSTIE